MDSDDMDVGGIMTSPSTHQKIRSRNAAMRLKHGSPQLKDVLRQRFRNRIKDSRSRLVERFRELDVSVPHNVQKVIQDEVSKILNSIDFNAMDPEEEARIREDVESETFSEQENWLMQQYDILMADDRALDLLWEKLQQVVCPVCEKGDLLCDDVNQRIMCTSCSTVVPARASLQDIESRIHQIINTHSDAGCLGRTYFFLSHEDVTVYAHCNTCSFLDIAV